MAASTPIEPNSIIEIRGDNPTSVR
jgi:hypothetical protein